MPSFTYERVKGFTGKLQYRTDGASAVTAAGRSVKRGEVIEVKNGATANAMALGGNFAHVAAETPLGVPDTTEDAVPIEAVPILTDTPPLRETEE